MNTDSQLEITDLNATIENDPITHDLNLSVNEGESVGLVGRNGAGKTTTFRSVMGLTELDSGSIMFKQKELTKMKAKDIPHLGIGYQPEDRKLFTGMTIDQNLRLPIWTSKNKEVKRREEEIISNIFDIFPELKDHRSKEVQHLSGGQAKMTSIGRALSTEPELLILDEPLEGLAPVVVENLKSSLETITSGEEISVLIAESNVQHLVDIVDKLYVIERGEIVAQGDPSNLAKKKDIQKYMQG